MTLNERELLQEFLHDLIQDRVRYKDPVADSLIQEACKRQPDALYILVQRLMIAEQTLRQLSTQRPAGQPTPHPAGATSLSTFLNPSMIASTALGVVAGSFLQQGIEAWLDSGDFANAPDLGDVDL
jgi:hypothetical protein